MTIDELRKSPLIHDNWPRVWGPLRAMLVDRVLREARKGTEAEGTKALADLLQDLDTLGMPAAAPAPSLPIMKPLNSMSEGSANPNSKR